MWLNKIRTIQDLKTEFSRDRSIEENSTRNKDRIEKNINTPIGKLGENPASRMDQVEEIVSRLGNKVEEFDHISKEYEKF